ncbi:putative RTA1 domain protein [Aspergillus stella-maris]|uniref:putative RTA1 domain protein n=1 Tax=Aspergillus stella-maris TaxID=1810926 RepID=UPI003CCE4D78
MANGDPVLWSLYVYAPNKGAPIFFTIAYAISAAVHIWQCYRYSSFRLIGLYPLCGVIFTLGYALREYGAYNYLYREDDNGPLIGYILSQVFVYICPPLLELANYHILARVFYYIPYLAPLPPSRVLSTFGGLMILVEFLNALGVSLSSNPSSSSTQQGIGSNMTIAALSLQIVVIITFVILSGLFQYRLRKAGVSSRKVTILLRTLYVSMTFILVRCIYRLVEHAGHTTIDINDMEVLRELTPVLRYEWFFYVFEASLMLVNMVLWNVSHVGRFLPRCHLVYLGRDGIEAVAEDRKDERSLGKRVGHVLSLGILYRKKDAYRDLGAAGGTVQLETR